MPHKLTVGSLFSGIGGFDLAAERAGMEIRFQVEIDPFCTKVLEKHWPHVARYRDVRMFPPAAWVPCECCDEFVCTWHGGHASDCECPSIEDWETDPYAQPHPALRVDVIVGGDPCQRNSNAWRHGSGADSPADQFIRIVDELRPRIVVRENPSAVRTDAPWPWWRFSGELERLGYAVLPFRLRACCVGADHARDRLLLLAALPDADGSRLEGPKRQIVARADEGRHYTDAAGPDRWSATPRVCRGVDGISHRMDRLRSLGNSIVPQVAEWLFRRIIEAHGEA
jgi:DNA (cytosine-5)-methyltransferase 1